MLAEFGTGQVFWSMLWFFLFFIWIWLLIVVFGDIFRSPRPVRLGQGALDDLRHRLPYLGVFVYLIARGHKMQEHALQAASTGRGDAPVRPDVTDIERRLRRRDRSRWPTFATRA